MKDLLLTAAGLRLHCVGDPGPRIAYVLYPMEVLGDWTAAAAGRYSTSVVAVTGIDWDNDLSPWPAPGQPPGSPDFRGEAPAFLQRLTSQVLPACEKALGHDPATVSRTLVGVSMSGLFTLWQRMLCDTFPTIASLSGSVWYEGFAAWLAARPAPARPGRAYLSLGDKESQSPVKAFRSVATDTQTVVGALRADGFDVKFESVPGNHYADPLPRLDRAFAWLYTDRQTR